MGSPPPRLGRLASSPTRLRLRIGPGPDAGVSRLKALRPQVPEKSGIAVEESANAGSAAAIRISAANARVSIMKERPLSKIRLVGFGHVRIPVVIVLVGILGTDPFRYLGGPRHIGQSRGPG